MNTQVTNRLQPKTTLDAIQVELQSGYDLSPIEAQVLARRVQELVDQQTGLSRQPGQSLCNPCGEKRGRRAGGDVAWGCRL